MRINFNTALRSVGFIVLLVVVGAVGLTIGHVVQGRVAPDDGFDQTLLETRLGVGDIFPDVRLVTSAGDTTTTSALLEYGGVVLFLDVECPPCTDMAQRWQAAIDDGHIENDWVVGVTSRLHNQVESYRAEHQLTFDILHDPRSVFQGVYGVRLFPFEVVVGGSGRIRSTSRELAADVDVDALLVHLTD